MWVPIWLILALIVLAVVDSFNRNHKFDETLRLKLYKLNEMAEKIATIEAIADEHERNGLLYLNEEPLAKFKDNLQALEEDIKEVAEAVGLDEPLFSPKIIRSEYRDE